MQQLGGSGGNDVVNQNVHSFVKKDQMHAYIFPLIHQILSKTENMHNVITSLSSHCIPKSCYKVAKTRIVNK